MFHKFIGKINVQPILYWDNFSVPKLAVFGRNFAGVVIIKTV